MIRNMSKSKAHALYDRATHCRKRSGSSSTCHRRSAFVDHQGIEHHPEHFFFRTATPPHFCGWREEDSGSDSDSDLETAPSPAFLGHHHHHRHRNLRNRQRAGSVASSSLSATLPPTSFFLPTLEAPLPTPNLARVPEPVTTLWINQPSSPVELVPVPARAKVKPVTGFRRGFEFLKLELRIGLLRTRKRMAKVWNRL